MPATCYIYTLHASNDPTCRPRYVGFTVRLIRRRIEHNTGRLCKEGRKGKWVKALLDEGAKAVLTVVHTFESDDGLERGIVEADWIEKYRDEFPDLLNDAPGGDGLSPCSPELRARRKVMNKGRVHSAETRAKVAASKIGKPRPAHVIEKLRQANLGRERSPEHREKMRQRMLGTKHTPETRAKISQANKGRKPSAEATEKRVAKLRGRKHSPAHCAKISAAGKGRKNSPESIARAAAKIRGQKRTPEQIERMRIAAQLRSTPEYRAACSKGQKRRFAKVAAIL